MTAKRYSVEGNWIKDNWIDKLLNIDFNTLDDAILCCDLLNNTEDKKLENGKIATQLLKENEQLKEQIADWETAFDNCKHYKEAYGTEIVKIKQTIKDMMENERTELGKMTIRALCELLGVELE